MSGKGEVVGEVGSQSGFVIPFDKNEFGEFLSGLLKSPKVLEHHASKPFILSFGDVEQLLSVVEDRIGDQATFAVVDSDYSAFYEDGSVSTTHTWNDFSSHSNLEGVQVVSLIIKKSYLVEFPNQEIPSRQEIEIKLHTGEGRKWNNVRRYTLEDEVWFSSYRPMVMFQIRHTRTTFGNDMVNLFKQSTSRFYQSNKRHKFLSSGPIGLIWFLLFAVFSAGTSLLASQILTTYLFSEADSPQEILWEGLLTNSIIYSICIFVVISACAFAAGVALYEVASKPPRSFVILNDDHKTRMRGYQSRTTRRVWSAVSASVISFVVGVSSGLAATGIWEIFS